MTMDGMIDVKINGMSGDGVRMWRAIRVGEEVNRMRTADMRMDGASWVRPGIKINGMSVTREGWMKCVG